MKNLQSRDIVMLSSDAQREFLHAQVVVERVVAQGIDLTANYDDWVTLGFSFASLGESGRDLFQQISSLYPYYDLEQCNEKFTNCLQTSKNIVSIATFFEMAKKAGVDVSLPDEMKKKCGRKPMSDTEKGEKHRVRYAQPEELMKYINDYGKWRFNEVKMEYEVKPDGMDVFRSCKDEDYNEIYRRAYMDNILTKSKQIETIIRSMQTEHFHPVKAYRDSLPACTILADGRCLIEGRSEAHDYIAEVASHLHTTSPASDLAHYFKIWVVQMVKSWVNEDEINQYVFGLLGPQGIFKTTFFALLLPPEFQKDYFDIKENNGMFGKDELMKMGCTLLYLQEEVDEMSPKELNQFKSISTMKMVNIRLPYARSISHCPRICSLALTGNKLEFLNDSTGNRRFLPFWVERIDNPYENPIDYEAFYAQAFKLAEEDSGFKSFIPFKEIELLNDHNKMFTIPILEHELVDQYLSKPYGTEIGVMETGGIITAYLQQFAGRQSLEVRKVTAYLRSQGYHHKRKKDNTVYYVVHLRAEVINSRNMSDMPIPDEQNSENDDDML